jgi:hypothetical protein
MKQIITSIVVGFLLFVSLPALSEEFRGHEGGGHEAGREHHEGPRMREHHVFAAHDYRHFNRYEHDLWVGGRWNKTCFAGRCGWWWFAEGQWYFYEQPVYPYPLTVSDIAYLEPIEVAPVIVAPQAPVMMAPPAPVMVAPPAPPQPAAPTWSYCESSRTYYPYVQSCPEGWKSVPAQPAPGAPR